MDALDKVKGERRNSQNQQSTTTGRQQESKTYQETRNVQAVMGNRAKVWCCTMAESNQQKARHQKNNCNEDKSRVTVGATGTAGNCNQPQPDKAIKLVFVQSAGTGIVVRSTHEKPF